MLEAHGCEMQSLKPPDHEGSHARILVVSGMGSGVEGLGR